MIDKLKEVDPLSIQKLLYFTNGFSNKILGTYLFNDLPEAWIHGPVYREIYDCFSYYRGNKINYGELLNDREYNLEKCEKEYLDTIIEAFGCYSGYLLREMTHLTIPWIKTRLDLGDSEYSNRLIDKEDIHDYFNKVCEDYNINDKNDIIKYSSDLFIKAKNNLFENKN